MEVFLRYAFARSFCYWQGVKFCSACILEQRLGAWVWTANRALRRPTLKPLPSSSWVLDPPEKGERKRRRLEGEKEIRAICVVDVQIENRRACHNFRKFLEVHAFLAATTFAVSRLNDPLEIADRKSCPRILNQFFRDDITTRFPYFRGLYFFQT